MEIIKWSTVTLLVVAIVLFIWACAKRQPEPGAPAKETADNAAPFKTTDAEASLALALAVQDINFYGGPDIPIRDKRWDVIPSPAKRGYYVVLKPDAVWFVNAADNMKVSPANEAARGLARNMPGPDGFGSSGGITYEKLKSSAK
jgi:hypothetical protein